MQSGSGKSFRLALVSNALSWPDDEGTRRFAQTFPLYAAAEGADVSLIVPGQSTVARVTFLSLNMVRALRASGAEVVVYVPSQSASTLSFFRSAVLRLGTKRPVAMIALQPRRRSFVGRWLIRTLAPDLVLTPSIQLLEELARLGIRGEFLPMGVDHTRFTPVPDVTAKRQLRRAYGLGEGDRIVLHVGHLKPGRNLAWMHTARELTAATMLVVAGTSMGRDESTAALLDAMGVRVLSAYFTHIQELYQLADAYVFPVQDASNAIGVPLSVLEAMACNLPVVTTPFGGLPRMFEQGRGLFFASDARQFAILVLRALEMPRAAVSTRELAIQYGWPRIVKQIVDSVGELSNLKAGHTPPPSVAHRPGTVPPSPGSG